MERGFSIPACILDVEGCALYIYARESDSNHLGNALLHMTRFLIAFVFLLILFESCRKDEQAFFDNPSGTIPLVSDTIPLGPDDPIDPPADIDAIAVTLTNVSKTFYLDGTFATDGTTQTLTLQTAPFANADGTYDWTLPESLIYPCPTGATATAITIVATDSQGHTIPYNTSTTTICSTGTRTALTTTWRTLKDFLSYGYTENPWTTTVQTGTFDM